MISDREIWQTAGAMIKRYGEEAATEAESRADELLVEGNAEGYAIWRPGEEACLRNQGSVPRPLHQVDVPALHLGRQGPSTIVLLAALH